RNAGTTGEDIYGRLLDSDGTPIGGDRRISGPKAIFDEHEPDLAWNQSAGGYLAVWQDERNDGTTGDDIYGRLLAADGSPAGGDHRLSGAAAAGNEYRPAVSCHGGTLRCLVVWHDSRNDMVRGFDIYGRYVGADGKASGYEVLVSGTAATGDEAIAALAGNQTSNRYQVIWQDYRNSGLPHFHGWDIYGRRVAG
nr:hypothetical protein [Acidimicrobiia bacterium]